MQNHSQKSFRSCFEEAETKNACTVSRSNKIKISKLDNNFMVKRDLTFLILKVFHFESSFPQFLRVDAK